MPTAPKSQGYEFPRIETDQYCGYFLSFEKTINDINTATQMPCDNHQRRGLKLGDLWLYHYFVVAKV